MRYKQKPRNAGECRGQRGNHDEGIQPGLKVNYDQQVYEHDRERKSTQKTDVGRSHRLNLSTDDDLRAARQLLASSVNNFVDVASYAAQIASRGSAKDVNDGRYVVMRNHCHSGASLGRYETGHKRRRSRWVCAGDRDVLNTLQCVGAILRRLRRNLVANTILGVNPECG